MLLAAHCGWHVQTQPLKLMPQLAQEPDFGTVVMSDSELLPEDDTGLGAADLMRAQLAAQQKIHFRVKPSSILDLGHVV